VIDPLTAKQINRFQEAANGGYDVCHREWLVQQHTRGHAFIRPIAGTVSRHVDHGHLRMLLPGGACHSPAIYSCAEADIGDNGCKICLLQFRDGILSSAAFQYGIASLLKSFSEAPTD